MWFFNRSSNKQKNNLPNRSLVSIRLEAIGGQGAHSAGAIIAEAAVMRAGYTGNHFSSFGSEKRGSPVKSFVRYSTENKPVRSVSFIERPDVLVLFHLSLIESHPEVLLGLHEESDLIINTNLKPRKILLPDNVRPKRIWTVDATHFASTEECGINAVMLGAVSWVLREIDRDLLVKSLRNYFSHLTKEVIESNVRGFDIGYNKVACESYRQDEQSLGSELKQNELELGYVNAPIGGIILNPGNSVLKDHSASRKGFAPQFIKELCFNCGYCDMVCPDYCFVWAVNTEKNNVPELMGLDYQYCKGCQKCVLVCPASALEVVSELDIKEESKKVKKFSISARNQIIIDTPIDIYRHQKKEKPV